MVHTGNVLNPAPAQPLPDSLLKYVDILTPNQSETELLSGMKVSSQEEASAAQRRCYALVWWIPYKRCCRANARRTRRIDIDRNDHLNASPHCSVDPVDTTGAGDAFCGALATALASGETLHSAVAFANAAGAAAVTVTLARLLQCRHARKLNVY